MWQCLFVIISVEAGPGDVVVLTQPPSTVNTTYNTETSATRSPFLSMAKVPNLGRLLFYFMKCEATQTMNLKCEVIFNSPSFPYAK